MRYVVFKGSIAVDGISLTVAGVQKKELSDLDHPAHIRATALRERKKGGRGQPRSGFDRQIR